MNNLGEYLKTAFTASGRKMTVQRGAVLEVLAERGEHLDADELYTLVKSRKPGISLATVYRTLAALKEIGLVEEHHLGQDHAHYKAISSEPHHHFICVKCGKVIEFESDITDYILKGVKELEGARVTSALIHLSGYCRNCQEAGL